MAIKIYGDKIVFPDNTEQKTASTESVWTDNGGTTRFLGKGNPVATQVWAENSGNPAKIIQKSDGSSYFMGHGATFFGTESELPVNISVDGVNKLAVGKDSIHAFEDVTAPFFIGDGSKLTNIAGTGGIPDAPVDGKQYGRQDGDWTPTVDAYTKAEIDAQQLAQDAEITANTTDIETNTANIAENTDAIQENTDAIQENTDAIDSLTGAIVYKGDINVTDTDAPVDSENGDMYINNYNVDEPDTEYPVTGWGTVATIKYNDRIIKTDADWDVLPTSSSSSDTYTKAEIDAQQDAQDVEIAKKANTADTYTKTQTDTLLDNKADVGDSYTKSETYNNTEIDSKLFEKADKTTTYTKDEVDASQDAQDVTISGNTSAIGTLSGRVSANESDIATLQDGIFFSSSYSADYPSSPNRDPENGNMYMQNLSAFTYSYADTNQVFLSKTDEQGNVRQFTAVKPDDTIVLNQVESPNYGRYKVTTVNDMGAYVNLVVEFQIGEGTLLEGDTVALQAFPASASDVDAYTKAEADAINNAQDVNIDANTTAIANTYTKTESDAIDDAQDVNILANTTAIANTYTKTESDAINEAQDNAIAINTLAASNNTTSINDYLAPMGEKNKSDIASILEAPGKMVWTGNIAPNSANPARYFNNVYTNTKGVPLFVQLYVNVASPFTASSYVTFIIDGVTFGSMGTFSGEKALLSGMFIVPAGSTYQLTLTGSMECNVWRESAMPVAVGTTGASVKALESRLVELEKRVK